MTRNMLIEEFYTQVIAEKLYSNKFNLRFLMESLFEGVPLQGKRVLDIGGGVGLCTFFAACSGAKEAICLEPEAAGASAGSRAGFNRLQARGLSNRIKLEPVAFEEYAMTVDRPFDVILLQASINHLDEWACINLLKEQRARQTYLDIFASFHRISNPGAYLIICDCARRNFFGDLGITSPFASSIEWHKHQSPDTWVQLAAEVGYTHAKNRWTSFNTLGRLGKWLLGNKLAAYFLMSEFRLQMQRGGIVAGENQPEPPKP